MSSLVRRMSPPAYARYTGLLEGIYRGLEDLVGLDGVWVPLLRVEKEHFGP